MTTYNEVNSSGFRGLMLVALVKRGSIAMTDTLPA
jgi:hypothetical protein